ncbi:hypothetical protein HHX47_DHR6000621 [Lentinula edodes]|nr:hypothetical protein HHX47_DHR6000621 [Lentinula edodes]
MATDFWASSHYKRWIVDRATLKQARADDLVYVSEPECLEFLAIYFANIISKLGKKLGFRQRVIATATVFFRRFYLKNSYCETDPYLVLSACCYVAAKAEESPVHIKNVVAESRALFSQEQYNVKHFPSDNSKLAEMEFYLVDDLECDLIVFHPYRTLLALCNKDFGNSNSSSDSPAEEAEAGELGTGIGADDGPRYWGTGQGQLELSEGGLQTAWFIINDTYRSELCLIYPPHLIAVTAIYLTLVLHTPTQNSIAHLLPYSPAFNSDSSNSGESSQTTPHPRRSSRTSDSSSKHANQQDPIDFLANLNVSLSAIATIAQEIISMYSLWNRYREDVTAEEMRNMNANANMGKRNAAGNFKSTMKGARVSQSMQSQKNLPRNVSASAATTSDMEWQLERQRFHGAIQLQAHLKKQGYASAPLPPQHMINGPYFMPQHPQQMQHRYPPALVPVSLGSLSPTKRSATGLRSRSGSRAGTPNSVGGGGRMEDLFGDGTSSGSPASHTSHAAGVGPRAGSTPLGNTPGSIGGADDTANSPINPWPFGQGRIVTAIFLSSMLNTMREARMNDMAHPSSGRPVVVNRMLERTW